MTVKILIDPPKKIRPEGAIRADVAWKLFLPDTMGDITRSSMRNIEKFRHWLWGELASRLGHLNPSKAPVVHILTPALTKSGKEFIVRTCSFWDDNIVSVEDSNGVYNLGDTSGNLWMAPVINVNRIPEEGGALHHAHESYAGGNHTYFSQLLGATRSFIRAYTIDNGNTYSRFHSHSVREELYLVLKGSGTIRIGGHRTRVNEGDLISKPIGPDISTQFLADQGEQLRVLDIEIWPEDEMKTKEVIAYPDHGEILFGGEGWETIAPVDSLMASEDALANYDAGYRRNQDGSWAPSDIPGFRKREK